MCLSLSETSKEYTRRIEHRKHQHWGHSENEPYLLVFETKGEHLKGNPDTDYKRRVFETLEKAFNVGYMTIRDGPAKGTFRLVFREEEFPAALVNLEDTYNT